MDKILTGTAFVLNDDVKNFSIECLAPKNGASKHILVAGENLGYELLGGHTVAELIEFGVVIIIAQSFEPSFRRDAINSALVALTCPGILASVSTGNNLEVYTADSLVKNITTGKAISVTKLSNYDLLILEGGGIKAILESQARCSGLAETEYTGWDTAKDLLMATALERDRVYYYYMRDRMGKKPTWADYQQTFFKATDEFLNLEIRKHYKLTVNSHEAGGQFRVAFPHMMVRDNAQIKDYMNNFVAMRREFVQKNYFHGYVDCDEIHHDPEAFIYFLMPMMYWKYDSADIAKELILDMAEHCGNFAEGVPDWYDWDKREFVSTWLGTKSVRAYPVFDYQEANHFRLINISFAALTASGDTRYLDLINSYCERWCEHIESHAQDDFIPCCILPANVQTREMGCAAEADANLAVYQTFYTTVDVVTMHDIIVAFFNAYSYAGNERYIKCAKIMMDQMVKHSKNGYPADVYSDGKWLISSENDTPAGEIVNGEFRFANGFLAGMMMMYDKITQTDTYRDTILEWASAINEDDNIKDLSLFNVLIYAHYYTGNTDYLTRAYDMYLRASALAAHSDVFHQCDSRMTYGNKSRAEPLYFPVFGCLNFAVRGSAPFPIIRHEEHGRSKLPDGVSFRLWKAKDGLNFEAVNHNQKPVEWTVISENKKVIVKIQPLGTTQGIL